MQPILMFSSPVSGMVYVNGRFVGETGPAGGVAMPVSPYGTVYLQLHPLLPGYGSVACRIAMHAGEPVPESFTGENLAGILWPGAITDIELIPRAVFHGAAETAVIGGHVFFLPPDCVSSQVAPLEGASQLTGRTADGQIFLKIISEEGDVLLDALCLEMERLPDGAYRLTDAPDGAAGPARVRLFVRGDDGHYFERTPQSRRTQDPPVWPDTPEQTALAVLDAHFHGLDEEAARFLSPAWRGHEGDAFALLQGFDGAVPLKYAAPGNENAVGVVSLAGAHFARVRRLYYRIIPRPEARGGWQLEALYFAADSDEKTAFS